MKKARQARGMLRRHDAFAKLLSHVSTSNAVTSLYYAGRLLQRRNDVSDIHKGFRVVGLSSEPTDDEQSVALTLINRIEQIEGHPVQKLSDKRAAKYINQFGKIASRKSQVEYGYTMSEGKELLAKLRSQSAKTGI